MTELDPSSIFSFISKDGNLQESQFGKRKVKGLNVETQDYIKENYQDTREPIIAKTDDNNFLLPSTKTDLIDILPEDIANIEKEQRKLKDPGPIQYLKNTAKGIGNLVTGSVKSLGIEVGKLETGINDLTGLN